MTAFRLPPLYAIADTATLQRHNLTVIPVVEAWLEAGIRLIQLRHKGNFTREIFQIALESARLCEIAKAIFLIDDRADIAKIASAGVHLGQDDLPPEDVRPILGPHLPIGFSTHNESQLAAANNLDVDYLAIGPLFATSSKANPDPVLGEERALAMRALTPKPLVAIGGITRDNAPTLLRGGIDSVAIISDLIPPDSSNLRARAEEWLTACRLL